MTRMSAPFCFIVETFDIWVGHDRAVVAGGEAAFA
jgi:hypothetical protein